MVEDNYYSRNKEARKDYQKQYYNNNKERIRRKRMMEELDSPEKFEARKRYNQEYYRKNKEQILKKRAELYNKRNSFQKNKS